MNQVNLFWNASTGNPSSYTIERSVSNTSSFSILTSTALNLYVDTTTVLSGSLTDVLTTSSYYYRIYASNATGTSSYSNIVKVPIGAIETWDEYIVNQSSSFISGSGDWLGTWKLDSRIREVSRETFDEYVINDSASFGLGFGWDNSWTARNTFRNFVSIETFDSYDIGATASFVSGSGWLGIWEIK